MNGEIEMNVYENLKTHNIELTDCLSAAGLYSPVTRSGNLLFVSGQGSVENNAKITGTVGKDISFEDAKHAARVCALNTLSTVQKYIGDLNRIKRVVKILGFVACSDDFKDQPKIIDGASQVFIDAFGEQGKHARSAIGSNSLPMGLVVELESIFEIE